MRRVAALLELLGNGGHLWRHVPVAARQTADGQGQPAAWSEQRGRERESSRIVEPQDQLVDVVRQTAGHDAGARRGAVHEDVGLVHLDPLLDLRRPRRMRADGPRSQTGIAPARASSGSSGVPTLEQLGATAIRVS